MVSTRRDKCVPTKHACPNQDIKLITETLVIERWELKSLVGT